MFFKKSCFSPIAFIYILQVSNINPRWTEHKRQRVSTFFFGCAQAAGAFFRKKMSILILSLFFLAVKWPQAPLFWPKTSILNKSFFFGREVAAGAFFLLKNNVFWQCAGRRRLFFQKKKMAVRRPQAPFFCQKCNFWSKINPWTRVDFPPKGLINPYNQPS